MTPKQFWKTVLENNLKKNDEKETIDDVSGFQPQFGFQSLCA